MLGKSELYSVRMRAGMRGLQEEKCVVYSKDACYTGESDCHIRAIQFCVMQVQNTVNMHTTTITNTKIIVSNVIHMYIKFPL